MTLFARILIALCAAYCPLTAQEFANSLNFAPRVSAPVLMVNATEDEYATKTAVEELYAVLPQPKELIWHQSGHLILMPAQQRIILPWLEKHLSP